MYNLVSHTKTITRTRRWSEEIELQNDENRVSTKALFPFPHPFTFCREMLRPAAACPSAED